VSIDCRNGFDLAVDIVTDAGFGTSETRKRGFYIDADLRKNKVPDLPDPRTPTMIRPNSST